MPSIGTIDFSTLRGLPQAPISPQQSADAIANGLAAGLVPPVAPREDPVELLTEIALNNEADCISLASDSRALIGKIVTVTVSPAVIVARQFVRSVDCKWKAVRGSTTGFLFTASWRVSATFAESDADDNRSLAEVYTAKVIGQWSREYKVRCFGAAEGLGSYAGECDLVQKIGTVNEVPEDPVNIVGKWVELRARTAVGKPAVPVWWGYVQGQQMNRVQSGNMANFHCVGLVDILRTTYLRRWYEYGGTTTENVVIDPGSIPEFNNVTRGNRSRLASESFGGGTDLYVHDRGYDPEVSASHVWRAKDIVETILSAISDQFPNGPQFKLIGQTDALFYECAADIHGMNIFDILQKFISPYRGMTFSVSPEMSGVGNAIKSTNVINIEVSSVMADTLTIPGGGTPVFTDAITFQAASRQIDVDWSLPQVTTWNVKSDETDVYDNIYVEAPRPWHMTTIGYHDAGAASTSPIGKQQLKRGWTPTQQDAWDAGDKKRRNQPDLANVWRRFDLKDKWAGNVYIQSAPPIIPGVSRNVNATGSEDGEFFNSGDAEWPRGHNIKLTRTLPIPKVDIDSDNFASGVYGFGGALLDHTAQKERIQAYKVTSGNLWTALHFDFEITMGENSCSITVGRNADDAAKIKGYIDDGCDLVFTVGYEFPKTWRMSWRRSPLSLGATSSLNPRSSERTLFLKVHGDAMVRKVIDNKAVTSLKDTHPNRWTKTEIWKPGSLKQALELAKIRYTKPTVHANWVVDGSVDLSRNMRPGVLVKSANVPYGQREPKKMQIGGVLTRRSWDFSSEKPQTSYFIAPMLNDVGQITAMAEGANGPGGFGNGNGAQHRTGG